MSVGVCVYIEGKEGKVRFHNLEQDRHVKLRDGWCFILVNLLEDGGEG